MSALRGSVGKGGRNEAGDVRLVQRLLNVWQGRSQRPLLNDDGIVGPKTQAAIDAYQRGNGLPTDARVDPNGPTIRKLMADFAGAMEPGICAPTPLGTCRLPSGGDNVAMLAEAFERLRD